LLRDLTTAALDAYIAELRKRTSARLTYCRSAARPARQAAY